MILSTIKFMPSSGVRQAIKLKTGLFNNKLTFDSGLNYFLTSILILSSFPPFRPLQHSKMTEPELLNYIIERTDSGVYTSSDDHDPLDYHNTMNLVFSRWVQFFSKRKLIFYHRMSLHQTCILLSCKFEISIVVWGPLRFHRWGLNEPLSSF